MYTFTRNGQTFFVRDEVFRMILVACHMLGVFFDANERVVALQTFAAAVQTDEGLAIILNNVSDWLAEKSDSYGEGLTYHEVASTNQWMREGTFTLIDD